MSPLETENLPIDENDSSLEIDEIDVAVLDDLLKDLQQD
ncbi:hypothetical protein AM1_C0346 (plasmid) [Acaryochloris marina MBIC11017]|uniref:Uncharacterized protein n=1 Tax=Acaryochloris marina (strain MBIC 11017) TaxID=329726 RepID=A8ZN74_ACAM1|nr:hypothetical protein AM1_C0346 [Acaryochloris marina MBIC11017]